MDPDLAAVEHRNTKDVAVLRWPGANDLGEEGYADAHDLARLAALECGALGGLLGTKLVVAHGLHRLLHGRVIVAGIVFPAERGFVRKLLALDKVLQSELDRIHTEFLRQDIHAALNGVGGFGDTQRATIGDASGCLVGIDTIDHGMGYWEIIRSRDDGKKSRRELARIGAGVETAMIGKDVNAKACDLA